MINPSDADDLARLQKILDELGEHFDTVQVFVTRYEGDQDGVTTNIAKGTGNWFARHGQVQNWANKNDEVSREEVRQEAKAENDQDDKD